VITVTADTNIYISALLFGGPPREFLNMVRARTGVLDLAVSAPLVSELQSVLRRKFGWSNSMVADACERLSRFTRLVVPEETLTVVEEDPDDNRVLECAVAAEASFVVSGDHHLLQLNTYRGIKIVRVAEFLKSLPPL
jgi:putative PIN family toxin of toxin-antitoxin system